MLRRVDIQRVGERGNVLFLILIAVALFAALSYAVTQSTRSGGGSTQGESELISSAQLTQYPAGIRTSLVRMIIGGAQVDEILFNDPSDFSTGGVIDTDAERELAVFHPQGGGATYQLAPSELVTGNIGGDIAGLANGAWTYNANIQIQNIGITDGGGGIGNDVVAFLPYIGLGVCRRLNEELGISAGTDGNGDGVPDGAAIAAADVNEVMDEVYTFPVADGPVLGSDFIGQPFGCFNDASGRLVYYHVLLER